MNVTSAKLPDSYHYSTHNLTPDDTPPLLRLEGSWRKSFCI